MRAQRVPMMDQAPQDFLLFEVTVEACKERRENRSESPKTTPAEGRVPTHD